MASKTLELRSSFLGLLGALVVVAAMSLPGHAGDVELLHVGEATTLHLEGRGWVWDKAASRRADLVSVKSAGAPGESQVYEVRGLKTGQVKLVFRRGSETFLAHVDVLK